MCLILPDWFWLDLGLATSRRPWPTAGTESTVDMMRCESQESELLGSHFVSLTSPWYGVLGTPPLVVLTTVGPIVQVCTLRFRRRLPWSHGCCDRAQTPTPGGGLPDSLIYERGLWTWQGQLRCLTDLVHLPSQLSVPGRGGAQPCVSGEVGWTESPGPQTDSCFCRPPCPWVLGQRPPGRSASSPSDSLCPQGIPPGIKSHHASPVAAARDPAPGKGQS